MQVTGLCKRHGGERHKYAYTTYTKNMPAAERIINAPELLNLFLVNGWWSASKEQFKITLIEMK